MNQAKLVELVRHLAALPREVQWVEWKVNNWKPDDVGEYISALSNAAALHGQRRAFLVWGIEDGTRKPIGTNFNPRAEKVGNEELEHWLVRGCEPRMDIRFHECEVGGKKIVVLEIPAAAHTPVRFKEAKYIRVGSYKKNLKDYPEKERALWRKLDAFRFERETALDGLSDDQVLEFLDCEAYYGLMGEPAPADPAGIVDRLVGEKMLRREAGTLDITNLGGLLFAKDIKAFPGLARKATRVVLYKGKNKIEGRSGNADTTGKLGYAAAFEPLVGWLMKQLPTVEKIGALRTSVPVYPVVAIRELVANALVHQDLTMTGTGPVIEVYEDRIEVTNPGEPLIDVERFLDHPPLSRNEDLASFMRRARICEERGSGIDKVVSASEEAQLNAPDFRADGGFTKAVLFGPRAFSDMTKSDRIRACYHHACLKHVTNERVTNATVRQRFRIKEENYPMASRIIKDTIDAGYLRAYEPGSTSKKHASYVPFWA